MRKIKFRAWDKDEHSMCLWETFKKSYPLTPLISLEASEHLIWMQYTGLKDKNGKEIYEGDVINMSGWSPENYEVGFREGGFCFYTPRAMSTDIKMIQNGNTVFAEVIGNIYENPDLLT